MKTFSIVKFNCLFALLLFFIGSTQMYGQVVIDQLPNGGPGGQTQNKCADLVNITQECDDNGRVTLRFYVYNRSFYHVNYIYITDGNGWSQGIPTSLPPFSIGFQQITYKGAKPGSQVCFTIKLYNPQIGLCCFSKECITVDDCPCAEITNEEITCHDNAPDTYDYCFEIVNPAYSNNTIDQITIFSNTPDVCLDGNPIPTTISIDPIPPGTTGQVCVVLSGCNAPLPAFTDLELIFFLEDSSDPAYCCHMDPITVTTPCCVFGDCTPFNFTRNGNTATFSRTIISGVTATVNISLNAYSVPDQLIVTVNGNEQINVTPGSASCVGNPSTMGGTINIFPCDIVVYTVIGDVCPMGGTAWRLTSVCNGNLLPEDPDNVAKMTALEASMLGTSTKRLAQTSLQQSLSIFPNPVTDLLNIRNTDSEISYESVRVMDSSGRTILTETMSGQTDLQLDVSSLPQGTYLVEMTDDEGNKTVEKILKLE